MKNYSIYTLFIALLFTTFTFAQSGGNGKRDKVKALKTAFITTELALTPQEAEKFWPIYNAFDDKQSEIRNQRMKSYLNRMEDNLDSMSEKEATVLLNQIESLEEENFQLKKKLVSDLKGVISSLKIIKLRKAEEDFKRTLLKQIRENRSSKRN